MNIKQTIRNLVLGGLLIFGIALAAAPIAVQAASCGVDGNGKAIKTSLLNCNATGEEGVKGTGLWAILLIAVNILTAGVGVLALAGIVYGAILYTSAGGNAEQVKKAMGVFTNVVIGVVAFGAMFALLNFLVPGGVFNSL